VDVIRHDGPRVQAITIAIEGEERVFNNLGDVIEPQPTGAPSAIKEFIPQAFRLRRISQPDHNFFW